MYSNSRSASQQNSQAFGEALRAILQARSFERAPATGRKRWTAATLARELGVDATLVRRWLRGEGLPPIRRPYITRLAEILGLTDDERHRLETALEAARGETALFSPSAKRNTETLAVAHLATKLQALGYPRKLPEVPSLILPSSAGSVSLPQHGDLILDPSQLVLTSIQLFWEAQAIAREKKKHDDTYVPSTIYLTFHGADSVVKSERMSQWWGESLHAAMDEGWNLVHHLLLDRKDPSRSIDIVGDMLAHLGRMGEHIPYYNYGTQNVPYDVILVPGIGGLICFATQQQAQVDAAIFVSDPSHLAMLEAHVQQLCAQSDLLLRSFSRDDAIQTRSFAKIIAEMEQHPGGRDLAKLDGFSALTRPASFYEEGSQFVAAWPPAERARRIAEMNARWHAFEQHVRSYPYRDICSKRAVLRYITEGTYARDDTDLVVSADKAIKASWVQVRDHVSRVIELLERHSNYELALVDQDEERALIGASEWEVIGDQSVLLEVFRRDDHGALEEIDLEITEPMIVRAFRGYFDVLWNRLRPINRDKEEVLRWLQQCIIELNEAHFGLSAEGESATKKEVWTDR